MTTDRDYSDMIDPFSRMEHEAERRGYWHAIRDSAFTLFLAGIVIALFLIP